MGVTPPDQRSSVEAGFIDPKVQVYTMGISLYFIPTRVVVAIFVNLGIACASEANFAWSVVLGLTHILAAVDKFVHTDLHQFVLESSPRFVREHELGIIVGAQV